MQTPSLVSFDGQSRLRQSYSCPDCGVGAGVVPMLALKVPMRTLWIHDDGDDDVMASKMIMHDESDVPDDDDGDDRGGDEDDSGFWLWFPSWGLSRILTVIVIAATTMMKVIMSMTTRL